MALHRYAKILVVATLLLVAAGGMVTSTSSGLSVPDWPTTYGYSMFTFPASRMVGGILYEHGHRLIASTVGLLTIGLVILLWRLESRRRVRWLGATALGVVILQGALGGLTVLFQLPAPISIGHASLAQVFFALTVTMALVTSPGWREPAGVAVDDPSLRRVGVTLVAVVYLQILLGAAMRHLGAGLAIPTFPLAYGRLLPPAWPLPVAIHFAHRVGALMVTATAVTAAVMVFRRGDVRADLVRPATLLLALIAVQITLGALVVLGGRPPVINTLHVATGALVFGTAVVIALRVHRVRFEERRLGPEI